MEGFTGNAVLDNLDVPANGVFARFPADKPYGYPDPATATHATLRVTYRGGDVRCKPAGDTTSGRGMNPDIVPASMTIAVTVDFVTEDGLFDEHVAGELRSVGSARVALEAGIPVADLVGSYRDTAANDPKGPSVPIFIRGRFTRGDLAGSSASVDHGERFVGTYRFDR